MAAASLRMVAAFALAWALAGPGALGAAEPPVAEGTPPVVAAAPALSAVVHVAPDGDDAAPGSAEQPVRSLRRALDLVAESGRVTLAAGTWREGSLVLPRGGREGAPLVIEGAGAQRTLIKGSLPIGGWQPAGGGAWKVEGWTTNCQQVFADGVALRQIGARSPWHRKVLWENRVCLPPHGEDRDDLVPGSFHHDGEAAVLWCRLADDADPGTRLIEGSSAPFLIDGGGSGWVTLRGIGFMHGNGTATGERSCLVKSGPVGWTLEDCAVIQGDFTGIGLVGERHTVRRCRVVGNGNTGLDIHGSDAAHRSRWYADRAPMGVLVEDCLVAGNNARGFYADWHAGGMKCIPACRGVTVRGCEVRDNDGPGIWFDHAHGGILIEDNLVVGNRTGIFYEISGPAPGDEYGALIRNNRVIGSAQQGIYISASRGAVVERNTLYGNWVNLAIHGMPRGTFALSGNVARDNLFGAAQRADVILFRGKDAADNRLEGNVYASAASGPHAIRPRIGVVAGTGYDITHQDLRQLAAETGCEKDGRCVDPGWRDPAKLDFSFGEGSPARDKGWRPK